MKKQKKTKRMAHKSSRQKSVTLAIKQRSLALGNEIWDQSRDAAGVVDKMIVHDKLKEALGEQFLIFAEEYRAAKEDFTGDESDRRKLALRWVESQSPVDLHDYTTDIIRRIDRSRDVTTKQIKANDLFDPDYRDSEITFSENKTVRVGSATPEHWRGYQLIQQGNKDMQVRAFDVRITWATNNIEQIQSNHVRNIDALAKLKEQKAG
jgi:hypothetical protein